jgi:2-amino-4-hydroxy-6-hydroxymethyldihydropteridine diphosphokinase
MALLRAGARGLLTTPGVRFVASSSVYETDPVGGPEQGAYLNAVLVVLTDLPPAALLERAQAIEAEQGRVRLERWGPRTLDIDVLSIGDTVSADPLLTLPHPRAAERAFVLVPWAEADGGYVVPGLGRTVTALLDELTALTDGEVRRVASPEELVHEDPA